MFFRQKKKRKKENFLHTRLPGKAEYHARYPRRKSLTIRYTACKLLSALLNRDQACITYPTTTTTNAQIWSYLDSSIFAASRQEGNTSKLRLEYYMIYQKHIILHLALFLKSVPGLYIICTSTLVRTWLLQSVIFSALECYQQCAEPVCHTQSISSGTSQ